MDAIIQSQVFFFISSVGFIILGVFLGILLFYLIRAGRALSRIIDKAEKDIDAIGDTTKEILEEIKENSLFQFISQLFKKGKKRKKN